MRDRQPTQPGRVKITPESGDAPFYATMEMADNPTDIGTPPTKANLLTDETETALFGSPADRTVDQAFAGIAGKLRLIMSDMATIVVTVKSTSGAGISGVVVAGVFDESGNNVLTNDSGTATGYVSAGTTTISVSGYADLDDVSETFAATKGASYTKTLTTKTKNFLKITSSRNTKFSGNVTRVDATVVGGGGGGGGGWGNSNTIQSGGGGGGGGNCIVKESAPFEPNKTYSAVIGSGGAGGKSTTGNYDPTAGSSGGNTSFLGVTAVGGNGGSRGGSSSGGAGGTGNGNGGKGSMRNYNTATVGGNGATFGYSSFTATVRYGGGGGGGQGGANTNYPGSSGGDDFGADYNKSASANTGGGGGGGSGYYASGDSSATNGGAGGSGVITVRMYLKTA